MTDVKSVPWVRITVAVPSASVEALAGLEGVDTNNGRPTFDRRLEALGLTEQEVIGGLAFDRGLRSMLLDVEILGESAPLPEGGKYQ